MIEVLRLSHRLPRDCRISTHCALTARAFGATKIYYSGQKDKELEESVNKITKAFGGPFEIEYTKEPLKIANEKKKQGFTIMHLTMYGLEFEKEISKIKFNNLLIIIGGAKVEPDYYQLADYNLSVSSQPISEVSALGIILYKMNGIQMKFDNKKLEVIPQQKGKLLKEHK